MKSSLACRYAPFVPWRAIIAAVTFACAALFWCTSGADEGMWRPQDLSNCPVETWKSRGLHLEPEEICNPEGPSLVDAIVKLGGGTGSFVSPNGLIVTNHHVAFRAIQRSSDVGSDRLAEGFSATRREDEIPAKGFECRVLLDAVDVTDRVVGSLAPEMDGLERYRAIDTAEKEIVEEAEGGRDVTCEVKPFYAGSQFFLYTYFKVKDVRLVYAPPQSIGEYGGDVDNWMWPRHTGDFAFMRAYVAPDGKSAQYSAENVPFRPRRYLRISRAPLSAGDFTMVLGYPYATRRYRSSYAIDFFVNAYYPRRIQYFGDILDMLDEESARGRAVEIKLAGTKKRLANSHKNYMGMLAGLKRSDLLAAKRQEEAELSRYAKSNPELEKKYTRVLERIGSAYDEYRTFWEQLALLRTFSFVSSPMRCASTLYKWAVEREKPDGEREVGYQDRDAASIRRVLSLAGKSYDERTDRRLFEYFIAELSKAGLAGRIQGVPPSASVDEVAALADRLYTGTRIMDDAARTEMIGMSREELISLDDPFIQFAAALYTVRHGLDERYKAFSGALQELRPELIELRAARRGGATYPDANSTMRLSVGEVAGYSPADAVEYSFQTTLSGVVEKHTGKRPFDAPATLLELHERRDFGGYADPTTDDVPVCFLTTNDVTGGNSGSPILNGRGELIGLVFDGNYESISADYQFVPRLTRTINVDSRYILFVLDKYSGARSVLDELTIVGGRGEKG